MCKRLGIIELDYFGLQFTGPKGETLWLNTRNRIRRQISGTPPYRLQFRVKFFVQPQYLLQDSTRYNLKMVYEFVNRGNGLNHDSLYYFPLALSSTVVYLSCWVERCQLYTQMLPFFSLKASVFSSFEKRFGRRENYPRSGKSGSGVCVDRTSNHWGPWRFLLSVWLLSGIRNWITVELRVS